LYSNSILLLRFNANLYNFSNINLCRLQGIPCKTLQWAGTPALHIDFAFVVFPNPNGDVFKTTYQLPQSKIDRIENVDVTDCMLRM
jgi:hypothetical protein